MVKWFKSLSRQEKMMAVLIVLLLVGVILRWDNVKRKALVWFRADELVEQQKAASPAADTAALRHVVPDGTSEK
ncbi:MAG TPA: hypothetical protein H9866_00855 [Candidatus Tidjanibacter gallistercoris]|nr:hypothetical protein [Candidatus Tidjanibacter gallistercoris]